MHAFVFIIFVTWAFLSSLPILASVPALVLGRYTPGGPEKKEEKTNDENEVAQIAGIAFIAWEDGGQVATVDGGVAHTEAAP